MVWGQLGIDFHLHYLQFHFYEEMGSSVPQPESSWHQCSTCRFGLAGTGGIGAKPNLYCEAIELVCGGSPKVCVLVERKALDRVKSEL